MSFLWRIVSDVYCSSQKKNDQLIDRNEEKWVESLFAPVTAQTHTKHFRESEIQSDGRALGIRIQWKCEEMLSEVSPLTHLASPPTPLTTAIMILSTLMETSSDGPKNSISNIDLWRIRNQLSAWHFGFFSALHLCTRCCVFSVQNMQWKTHGCTIFLLPRHKPSTVKNAF